MEQAGVPDLQVTDAWLVELIRASQNASPAQRAALERIPPAAAERAGLHVWALQNRWALGFLELALGNPGAALVHLDGIAARYRERGFVEQGLSHYAADELEALIAVGRLEDAEHRMAEEAELAERLDRDRMRGVVARARGALSSVRGEHQQAVDHLYEAERLHAAGPLPFDHGRTLLALGTALRRAGRRRESRAALQRAVDGFTTLGAQPWIARAEAELGRLGGRVASPDELTSTEQRVAALVAEGKSNREVAAELVVSVRAVEANLTRVYAKLRVRSRAELAHRFRSPL
jgi:DNA-binding NarL/FixJ family response regulator